MPKKIDLNFEKRQLGINWDTQEGIESSPELQEQKPAVLSALSLEESQIESLQTDFDEGIVTVRYRVPDLADKQDAFLKAIDYGPVDLSNSVRLIEALLNHQLPPSLVKRMLEEEVKQNEADPTIKAFLDMLPND